MSKRRRIKLKKSMSKRAAIVRMGDLLAAGHGTEKDVELYNSLLSEHLLNSAIDCIAIAEEKRSWVFMDGAFKQASEIYVLASILYEKYPEYSIMTDGAFDALAKFLLKNREKVDKAFWEWYNITAIDLKAGTGHRVVLQPPVLRMLDLHLKRNGYGNKPRLLRKSVIRGRKKAPGGKGSRTRRIVRRSS